MCPQHTQIRLASSQASLVILKCGLLDAEFKHFIDSLLRLGASIPTHRVVTEPSEPYPSTGGQLQSETPSTLVSANTSRSSGPLQWSGPSPSAEQGKALSETWVVKINPNAEGATVQEVIKIAEDVGADVRHQWRLVQYRGFNMRANTSVADLVSQLESVERVLLDRHSATQRSPKERTALRASDLGPVCEPTHEDRTAESAQQKSATKMTQRIATAPLARSTRRSHSIRTPDAEPTETPTKPRKGVNAPGIAHAKEYIARLAAHTTPATVLLTMQTIRTLGARVTQKTDVAGHTVLTIGATHDLVRMMALLGPIVEINPNPTRAELATPRPRRRAAGEWIMDDILLL